MKTADVRAARARLAEVDTTLGRLRAEYDELMNRFKFEAATAVQMRIAATEAIRAELAAALPPSPPAVEPGPYAVLQRRPRRR